LSGGLPTGFWRLIAAIVAVHACMATTRVASTLWLLHTGHGEVTVGVLLALVALAPALLGPAAGAWADRYGLWKPLKIATALALVGTAAPALWTHVSTLVLGAIGTGGAIGVAAIAVQREVAQRARELTDQAASQRMYSWVALGPALSNTLAPLLAGGLCRCGADGAGGPVAAARAPASAASGAHPARQQPPGLGFAASPKPAPTAHHQCGAGRRLGRAQLRRARAGPCARLRWPAWRCAC